MNNPSQILCSGFRRDDLTMKKGSSAWWEDWKVYNIKRSSNWPTCISKGIFRHSKSDIDYIFLHLYTCC